MRRRFNQHPQTRIIAYLEIPLYEDVCKMAERRGLTLSGLIRKVLARVVEIDKTRLAKHTAKED